MGKADPLALLYMSFVSGVLKTQPTLLSFDFFLLSFDFSAKRLKFRFCSSAAAVITCYHLF